MNLSQPLRPMDVGDTLDTTATVGDSQANGSSRWVRDIVE